MKNKEKKIWIAGPGLGGMRLMTRQVSAVLKMAQLFIGSREVLETVRRYASENGARCVSAVRTAQVRRAVVEAEEERIVVLTAEDPATSASARDITRSLADLSPVILPGIPVVSYAASRFGITCPDAVYADLNCSRPGIAALCRQHEYVLIRTGVHTQEMFEQLMEAGLRDVQMMVLDRPAGEKERVLKGRLGEMAAAGLTGDTLCLFIRAATRGTCGRTLTGRGGSGTAANNRRELPKEIRSAALARLSLTAHDTVYVFGAGTGETAIEAAEQAALDTVYAFENREEELAQLRKNCAAMGAGNVQIITGNGLAMLNHLPSPDAVIVSGNPESVIDLLQICLSRNPDTGLVVVTHSFEKATAAAAQMEAKQLENEFLQITSCRASAGKDGHVIAPGETAFIVSRIES